MQFNINEAQSQFSELIRLALMGEEVIIAKRNKPLVRLVPIEKRKIQRKLGTAKGLVHMSDDFNEPLEDFIPYIYSLD